MKKCYMCKKEKEFSSFSKKTSSKDGYQSRCNDCMSKTMSAIYYRNVKDWNNKCRKNKARKYIWVNNIKSESGCSFCKEKDFCCLEFHHKTPSQKEYEISKMISNSVSDNRIKEEIKKCIVICANCHRKLHANRFNIGSVT